MPPNGGPGIIEIPATIYRGMFEGEFQISVEISGETINLIVSTDSVVAKTTPNDEGVEGQLKVEIVEPIDGGYLIHLPGEVQGASNRMEYVA